MPHGFAGKRNAFMDQSQPLTPPQHLAAALSSAKPAQHAPMAFSIPAACKASGVSRTKIYEAIQSGALIARKNGAKNLILREDLERWLQNLPTEKAPTFQRRSAVANAASVARRRAPAAA
jgi:excisionase family DNA binding protein